MQRRHLRPLVERHRSWHWFGEEFALFTRQAGLFQAKALGNLQFPIRGPFQTESVAALKKHIQRTVDASVDVADSFGVFLDLT